MFILLRRGDISIALRHPTLDELAKKCNAVHAGVDGKTGETLMKSILAELFVRRNLRIQSWFGQNILGNDDGRALNNLELKETKIRAKDHILSKIAGYTFETKVGIDYVSDLGEKKVAWNYINFDGFFVSTMNLQFIWSTYDSILAAQLVIDLIRFCSLAQSRGENGIIRTLSSFFKDPMGVSEQRFISQDEFLVTWALGKNNDTMLS